MKILSFLLSFVMAFTALPFSSLVNRNPSTKPKTEAVIENDDITVEGGSGIGGILSNAVQESQQTEAEEDAEENVSIENKILDVVMTDNIATVSFNNDKICKIIVAVFDEEGNEMLAHGMLENIEEYAETAYVTIDNGTIPQYYLLRAFLLDENNIALHKSFETNYYTKEHQEFLAKTTDDFEGEEILNLDEDKTNNFAVYNDGVIHITENGENTLLSADDETLTYVFENINSEVENLKIDDIVNYNSGDTSLIFKVKTITFDGSKATVTGDEELALDEVFNFMKIDTEYTGEQTEMDMSESDEGVTFNGFVEEVQTYKREINLKKNLEFSFDVGVNFDLYKKDSTESVSVDVKFKNNFDIEFALRISLYSNNFEIDFSYDQTRKDELFVKFSGEVNGSLIGKDKEITLGKLPIPLGATGLSLLIKIDLVFNIEVEGSIYQESRSNMSFSFDLKHGFTDKSKKYDDDFIEINVEGKVFFGIKIFVGISALTVVELGGEITAGVEVTAELHIRVSDRDPHKCSSCCHISSYFVIKQDVALNVKVLILEMGVSKNIFELKFPGKEFYNSAEAGFGVGECPNYEIPITVRVIGFDGSPIADADVNGQATDSDGKTSFIVPKGDFTVSASKEGYITRITTEDIENAKTFVIILPKIGEKSFYGGTVISENDKITNSGSCGDNVDWTLHESGTLVIVGEGDMKNYVANDSPWRNNSKIKKVVIGYGVTSIGANAFPECINLTSVTIANSVISIGNCAFYNCVNLKSVTIPDSVTSIGDYAFGFCSSLASVTIGDSVTTIYTGAFSDCSSLESVTIPDSVTTIYTGAFSHCYRLMSVTIGDSVTYIGIGAFTNCSSLTSITIPDSVTSIDEQAFLNCSSLTSITIPDSVTSIGVLTFCGCSSLNLVAIPDSVTSIGGSAFLGCSSLNTVLYSGSEEQWNKISIGSENDDLLNAAINYNSGILTTYVDETAEATFVLKKVNTANIFDQHTANTLETREVTLPKTLAESETVIDDPLANTVTKDDLVPGSVYTLIIISGTKDDYALTNDSLLYITDTIADESGVATFTHYCNFATTSWVAVVYGECNHHASDWVTVAEPTSTVKGLKAQYCTKCSETVANEEIDIIPEKISILSLPEKLTYNFGEELDLTGLTAVYTYTDGRDAVSADYSVFGYSPDKYGEQTVVIESGIYKASFTVTVALSAVPDGFTDKITAGATVESLSALYPDAVVYAVSADGKKAAKDGEILKTGMILQIVDPDGTVHGVNVIVNGDTTGDGVVNAKDILRIKKQIVEGSAVEHIEYADINGDGVVNNDDISALQAI